MACDDVGSCATGFFPGNGHTQTICLKVVEVDKIDVFLLVFLEESARMEQQSSSKSYL